MVTAESGDRVTHTPQTASHKSPLQLNKERVLTRNPTELGTDRDTVKAGNGAAVGPFAFRQLGLRLKDNVTDPCPDLKKAQGRTDGLVINWKSVFANILTSVELGIPEELFLNHSAGKETLGINTSALRRPPSPSIICVSTTLNAGPKNGLTSGGGRRGSAVQSTER